MNLRKIFSALLTIPLIAATFSIPVFAEEKTAVFYVDSLNGTRWADYLCVYRDIDHTGQNEWGENVVVDSDGIVTEKIPGADIRGKNLLVPEGGMVVSGTGNIGKEMYNSVEIGDKCLFDEYSMQVYFSKGEINPFYTETIRVTGYNTMRNSDTVIIYNKSGNRTETNVFGYEVCVDAEGYVISSGGNNNIVPNGGYVISAIEAKDTNILKMYFTVGAKCDIDNNSVKAEYGQAQLAKTVENELELIKSKLETAKSQYKLIDYDEIEEKISSIKIGDIDTIEERNAIIAKIRNIEPMLVESRLVETRSVWYTATETTASEIKATVDEMKEVGINELVLSTSTPTGTIIPIDTDVIPFKRNELSKEIDILQTYIDECRANGISIIALTPVMSGAFGEDHREWYDVTNTGEEREELFFSPANGEYRKAFMDYIRFIIANYDIDGLQLDYIRYSQFHGGIDAGYDEATIKLFEEKTGYGESVVREIGKKLSNHPKWNIWWNFKTELINSWVEEVYGIADELRPDIFVSAAVAASDSVGNYCQNPDAWVKGGYIDGIYVMSYVEEINETSTAKHIAARSDKSYLVMGCGAYLSISNKSLIEQTDNSSVLGADGTGYFEWGAVKSHRYTEVFKDSLFKNKAIPFTADINTVVDSLVATAKARIRLYCTNADKENAANLKAIMDSLPDKNADKEAISAALNSLGETLGEYEKVYLTADLNTAIRAINMQNEEFNASVDENGSAESSSVTEQESENSGNEKDDSGFPIVPIIIGVIALIIITVAVIIFKSKK